MASKEHKCKLTTVKKWDQMGPRPLRPPDPPHGIFVAN